VCLKSMENIDEGEEKKHSSNLETQNRKESRRWDLLYDSMSDATRAGHDPCMT
jgi:hypothetical protein